MEQFNIENTLSERKETIKTTSAQAYEAKDFEESNRIMAELTRDTLGEEAADSLRITDFKQRENLKFIFYNAAVDTANVFQKSFNDKGEYLSEHEDDFWAACDKEGPIAIKNISKGISVINNEVNLGSIRELTNNVSVEDAVKLSLRTLQQNGVINNTDLSEIESQALELCKDQKAVREMLLNVVPKEDYYYARILREQKRNDESILKFNSGISHSEDDLKVIDLSLRLANATWFAAQRHSAKKAGNTERINPDERGGVFNSPDYRHVKQFEEAKQKGLTDVESTLRVAFELCKDSWQLED